MFLSEEAWIFYQNYAHLHGFSIRKNQTEKRDGNIIKHVFFYHRGRPGTLKEIDTNMEQRSLMSNKCKCKANLRIKIRRYNEFFFSKEWHVTTFIPENRHALLSKELVRFLLANRIISP